MKCQYCNNNAKLVTGNILYPHRPDLYNMKFWNCKECDAYVGCHPGTDKPLGILANAELRRAKRKAHEAFDPVWKNGKIKRADAYKWLADKLGIRIESCHIGMFNVSMCKEVVNKMSSLPTLKANTLPE